MQPTHLALTCTLPTGGSVDESQDSGGSGNFLSPGAGQGLASPNRSAPPAASARPRPAGRSIQRQPGSSAPGKGSRLPAPLWAAGLGSTCVPLPARRKGPAQAARGPRGLPSKQRPARPQEMNGSALLLLLRRRRPR